MKEWRWRSPALDREMSVARWGAFGKALLLFPTSGSDHLDVMRFKLIDALEPLIEGGRLRVYSCESVARDGWNRRDVPPWRKTSLQAQYDEYLTRELCPFLRFDSGDSRGRFAAAGASFGAYSAVTTVAKHPEHFDLAIGLSGFYDIDALLGGYRDDDAYFNDARSFLPNLGPSRQLSLLQQSRFVLGGGLGRWERPQQAVDLARVFVDKAIPVRLEMWGPEWDHDWPTWRAMLPQLLAELT